jgi:hypothetical protein
MPIIVGFGTFAASPGAAGRGEPFNAPVGQLRRGRNGTTRSSSPRRSRCAAAIQPRAKSIS